MSASRSGIRRPRFRTDEQDELMSLLQEKYGKPQARVTGLQRLFAPFRAIASLPDAYYKSRYEHGDLGRIPREYAMNLARGLGTTFLGHEEQDKKFLSNILMREGQLLGQDPGSKATRLGLDLAGEVLINPLTYISFGQLPLASKVAGGASQRAVKMAGLKGQKALNATEKLTKATTGKDMTTAAGIVRGELGETAADAFSYYLTSIGQATKKAGDLKFMGKTLTKSPQIAEGIKTAINPLHAVSKGVGKAGDIVAPTAVKKARIAVADMFDPAKAAAMSGRPELATLMRGHSRRMGSIPTHAEAVSADWLRELKKVPKQDSDRIMDILEQTTRKKGKAGNLLGKLVTKKDIAPATRKWLDMYARDQSKMAKMLEGIVKPIPQTKMLYGSHMIKGFTPKFLRSEARKGVLTKKQLNRLMGDKKVQSQIAKDGMVDKKTVDSILGVNNILAKKFQPDKLQAAYAGQGARKERVFDTFQKGEKAGIVYEKDPAKVLPAQTQRQMEQIEASRVAKQLKGMTDLDGNPMFTKKKGGLNTISKNLPGVGQVYTDKRTARALDNFLGYAKKDTGYEELLSGFDSIMASWKGLVTGKGPGFLRYQTRNAFDDYTRMIVDGADVSTLPVDIKLANEINRFNEMATRQGLKYAKKNFKSPEVKGFLQKMGRYTDGEEADGAARLWNELLEGGVLRPGRTVEEAGQHGTGIWDRITSFGGRTHGWEQQRRVAHYLNNFRQTGSRAEAAEAVKRALFNYDEMSAFEKTTMKRLVPFYSFIKNNLQFQFSTMAQQPQRYAKFISTLDSLQNAFVGPDREVFDAMPGWMAKYRYGIPIGDDPEKAKVLTNLGMSFEDLEELDMLGTLGKINPVLSFLIERTTGTSAFRRGPIMDKMRGGQRFEHNPLAKLLMGYEEQEREGYTRKTVDPMRRHAVESLPFVSTAHLASQQLARTLGPLLDPKADTSRAVTEGLMETLFPARIYEMDVEPMMRRKEYDDLEGLYELLYRKGSADRFSKYYIPSDIRDKLLRDLSRR